MKIGREEGRLGQAVLKLQCIALPCGFGGGVPGFVYGRGRLGNFRALVQLDDGRIGDFPAEGLDLALLPVALFQENGLPRVRSQLAGGRQGDLSSAVSDDDAAA